MKVISGIGKVKRSFKNIVLVIGVFDGLHLGHQKLIKKAVEKAKLLKTKTVVMTFFPHPVQVLRPEISLPLIVSLPHRLKLIEQLGVDAAIVIRFTKKFSKLSPEKFIKDFLVNHLQPINVFVGDDFRFGQDRTGTLEYFKEAGEKYGFEVNVVDPVKTHHEKISSTRIRQLIAEGELDGACRLLGRHVSLMGKVIKGDGRGRKLGFPTANILPNNELIPPLGVYVVNILVGKKVFHGMANIGRRPSFKSSNNQLNIEVNIFNFHKNVYGRNILVEFIHKIREEKFFNSKHDLIAQLKKDALKAKQIFPR